MNKRHGMQTRHMHMKHKYNAVSRVMGVAYAREGSDVERGIDEDGNAWFYDVRSSCGATKMTIQLLRSSDLTVEEGTECSIALDKFDDVRLDCTGDAIFSDKIPKYCIGLMKCGHMFSILSLVNHMAMCNMMCPMCRDGCEKKMHMKSVPKVISYTLSHGPGSRGASKQLLIAIWM
jgi:hypothetical protein